VAAVDEHAVVAAASAGDESAFAALVEPPGRAAGPQMSRIVALR